MVSGGGVVVVVVSGTVVVVVVVVSGGGVVVEVVVVLGGDVVVGIVLTVGPVVVGAPVVAGGAPVVAGGCGRGWLVATGDLVVVGFETEALDEATALGTRTGGADGSLVGRTDDPCAAVAAFCADGGSGPNPVNGRVSEAWVGGAGAVLAGMVVGVGVVLCV